MRSNRSFLSTVRLVLVMSALFALSLAALWTPSAGSTPLTPTQLLHASPESLQFRALGAANQQHFVLSTSASPLVASVANPNVVSVAAGTDKDPLTHTFIVTPLAAGTTNVTVTDTNGMPIAVIPVTVGGPAAAATAAPGSNGMLYGIGVVVVGAIAALFHSGSSGGAGAAPTTPPTTGPSSSPSGTPTSSPSGTPTSSPSGTPTSSPSGTPTSSPSGTPSNSPTPFQSPTPIPATPTPGPLAVNPTHLSFVIGQPPSSAPFTASETGYSGAINAVTANVGDATVSPSSGTGPSATFTVTAKGPGTTTINVNDTAGNQAAVTVTVTQTNVVVNGRTRAGPRRQELKARK